MAIFTTMKTGKILDHVRREKYDPSEDCVHSVHVCTSVHYISTMYNVYTMCPLGLFPHVNSI